MRYLISLIALLSLTMWLFFWAFSFQPSAEDAAQAFAVAANVNYPFQEYDPDKTIHPPSIYVKPGVKHSTFIIYGISNTQEQNKVLQLIKVAKVKVPQKAIQVRFMDKEIWIQVTSAMRSRGREKLLRTVLIQ